jgi:hypothetical protein
MNSDEITYNSKNLIGLKLTGVQVIKTETLSYVDLDSHTT